MSSLLANGAQAFGLALSQPQLAQFDDYLQALITWNQRVNLTSLTEPAEIEIKHFLDSLSVWPYLPPQPAAVIDIGSGAGFPGLPLKIARPELRLTLLESTRKKTAFLQYVVDTLGLAEVTVLPARAEQAGRQQARRGQYDVAVARAVAALPVLAEYGLPLLKEGGQLLAQKGQPPTAEIEAAGEALARLGGQVMAVHPLVVPHLDAARHLVIIRKVAPTPARYPRRPGRPAKSPL